MTAPKKTDPLTPEEVGAAADEFFALFNVVADRCPPSATTEDVLKFCETVFMYAHKLRAKEIEEESSAPFGFNKKGDS